MKNILLVMICGLTIGALAGCSGEQKGTPEQDQAKVKEANEAAVNSPTSGAANPEAAAEAGQ